MMHIARHDVIYINHSLHIRHIYVFSNRMSERFEISWDNVMKHGDVNNQHKKNLR